MGRITLLINMCCEIREICPLRIIKGKKKNLSHIQICHLASQGRQHIHSLHRQQKPSLPGENKSGQCDATTNIQETGRQSQLQKVATGLRFQEEKSQIFPLEEKSETAPKFTEGPLTNSLFPTYAKFWDM